VRVDAHWSGVMSLARFDSKRAPSSASARVWFSASYGAMSRRSGSAA
jgi:hypothetical protein